MKKTASTVTYKSLKLNGDVLTPISVFSRLKGRKKFLLESSSNHTENGRYSMIGVNPYKEVVGSGKETIVSQGGRTETKQGKPLEVLKQELPEAVLDLPFRFFGGAVGYIGYDVIRQYEEIGRIHHDEIGMPDVHMMLYQEVIVFDHLHQNVTILALDLDGKRTEEELQQKVEALKQEIITEENEAYHSFESLKFTPYIEKEEFLGMVEKAKQHVTDGDIFQVVLSQRMRADFHADPFAFYRSLRRSNPSPYMFYLDFDSYIVLGASPESLIKISGRQVITNPIAGTRKRGKTEEEDRQLAEELLADEKELAEHKMLVDLSRNDLGRVCEIGSIEIPKFMVIERFSHVMHIVSEVQGTLRETYSGIDALVSTLPAGTVSGAPKIRAMQIINELEKERRGAYAGAVGYINVNGDLDLALAIRTLVIKDKVAYVQAGAGIVYDSDPESEYEETLNKAKSLVEVKSE